MRVKRMANTEENGALNDSGHSLPQPSTQTNAPNQDLIASIPKRLRSSNRRSSPVSAVADLAGLIRDQGKQVVFLTGAGLSCASGIPPFRGTKDAIWTQSVYEWGTKEKFLKDPLVWYREFFLRHFTVVNTAKPNAGHIALAEICRRYPQQSKVITQNVDMLHSHEDARIPSEQLIEVHGRVNAFKCFTEGCPYAKSLSVEVVQPVMKEEDIPRCPNCSALCCPNTLLFDEQYSDHDIYQFDKALNWLRTADVIVFVGTSFAVGITNFAFEAAMEREKANGVIQLFNFNVSESTPRVSKTLRSPMQCVKGLCELTLPLLAETLSKT